MTGGPVVAQPNLQQYDQDRNPILKPGELWDPLAEVISTTGKVTAQQLEADTRNAEKQVDKLFGGRIGKHQHFGDNLHTQFKEFLDNGSAELKALPKAQQFEAFVKAKEEEALKMLVDALKSTKPSSLPVDYEANKDYYNSLYKAAIDPKIAEMFGKDVRLARHRPDLYGNGDTKIDQGERGQMTTDVSALLQEPSQVAQEQQITTAPTSAPMLTPENAIGNAIASLFTGVQDPAGALGTDPKILVKKGIEEFDNVIKVLNEQLIASDKPLLTKEEEATLLKQFNEELKKNPIGSMYTGLAEGIEQFVSVREDVKAYQTLLADHKKTTEDKFFLNQSPAIKEAILNAQEQEVAKFTEALATKMGISKEDAKILLENSYNPSPDVGSPNAVTLALIDKQEETRAAHVDSTNDAVALEHKLDVYKLLEGNVFNKKFSVPGPNGTPQQLSLREIAKAETAEKIAALTGTPEEIAKQTKELLAKEEEMNILLDRSYAAAMYQKRYQEAYDKALEAAGGAEKGKEALEAAEKAALAAGQKALDYLAKNDKRGSLKDFNAASPSPEMLASMEQLAYDLRAMAGFPIEPVAIEGKPEGSQA